MSEVLVLASDFIERMSNPSYGIRVNEDYSMRLGALLSSERFESLLRREVEQVNDPESLTPHGWLWLLRWARANGMRLNDKLLFQLAESFSSVFMQMAVIDLATLHIEWRAGGTVQSIDGFDDPFLSKLLRACTLTHSSEEADYVRVDTKRAETVLVALMQIGTEVTLDAASALLNHRWTGQSQLVQFFSSICGELDDETRRLWVSRLRVPEFDV